MSRFFLLLDQASNQLYEQLIDRQQYPNLKPLPASRSDAKIKLPGHNPYGQTYQIGRTSRPALSYHTWPLNFNQINAFLPDQDRPLEYLLEPVAQALIQSGAAQVLIPNITLSLVIRRLNLLEAQLVDPVSLLRAHLSCLSQKTSAFTILGGKHTAQSAVWNQASEQNRWAFSPTSASITGG